MYPQEKIDEFVLRYGFRPRNTNLELKHLPQILRPSETLCTMLEGMIKRVRLREFNGIGVVIVTNERLIFFRKSLVGNTTLEDFSIETVTGHSQRKGIMTSSLTIVSSSGDAVIDNCNHMEAARFCDVLQNAISGSKPNAGTPGPAGIRLESSFEKREDQTMPLSVVDQLEKLFELKTKGAVTDEEYALLKAKLLS